MDNQDILYLIIKNRELNDNIKINSVNKLFYNISHKVYNKQCQMLYFFRRFKKRTFFNKKKKIRHTYYTLKNMYINKEEQPILFF